MHSHMVAKELALICITHMYIKANREDICHALLSQATFQKRGYGTMVQTVNNFSTLQS